MTGAPTTTTASTGAGAGAAGAGTINATTVTTGGAGDGKQEGTSTTVLTDAAKTETAKGGTTAGDQGKAQDGANADLVLTLPDGMAIADEELAAFKALAKTEGLSQKQAQAMVNAAAKASTAEQQRQLERTKAWAEAARSDKEFGGDKFEASIAKAKLALDKLGATQDLKDELNRTGMGNHPDFIRLLYRAGLELSEDSVAGTAGTGGGGQQDPNEALVESLYNHPTSQKYKKG